MTATAKSRRKPEAKAAPDPLLLQARGLLLPVIELASKAVDELDPPDDRGDLWHTLTQLRDASAVAVRAMCTISDETSRSGGEDPAYSIFYEVLTLNACLRLAFTDEENQFHEERGRPELGGDLVGWLTTAAYHIAQRIEKAIANLTPGGDA